MMRLAWGAAAALVLLTAGAFAQDLPKTQLKGIGLNGPTPASIYDELPFWRKTIPAASKGAVTMDITPLDQMGVDDKTMLRLLKLGVADFASMDISKMAGDDPRFEGCDLAGLTLDTKAARAACDAYREVLDKRMEQNWNAKLMAFGGNAPQVFWCRDRIEGLHGLKGKKVRVFNRTMNDFIEGVGGTTVSMAFAEVVPALQRGTVDCGVTGSASGNTASWFEVANYLYPLSLGWSINVHAFNLSSWKKLDPKVQEFLLAQFKSYEDKMWQTIDAVTTDAENCNFGKDPCKFGKKANMVLIPVSDADQSERRKLMETRVLAAWAKRCGAACAKEWNETVGKAVGLTAPTS